MSSWEFFGRSSAIASHQNAMKPVQQPLMWSPHSSPDGIKLTPSQQAATAPSSGRKRTGAAPSGRFSKLQGGADEDDAADGISLSVGPTPTGAQELGACTASVAELAPKQEKEEEDEASDTATVLMDDSDAAADPSKAPGGL